jgi:hypothetical protein
MAFGIMLLLSGCLEGLTQDESGGSPPPDTQVAVGPSHIVEAVNSAVRIWDRASPPALLATLNPDTLVGCDGSGDIPSRAKFDPALVYDLLSGRFILVYAQGKDIGGFGAWCIAVSATSDPMGTWYKYEYPVENPVGTFPDFPKIGISDHGVAFTAEVRSQGGDHTYVGQQVIVYKKSAMLNPPALQWILVYTPAYFSSYTDLVNQFFSPTVSTSSTSVLYFTGHRGDVSSVNELTIFQVMGTPGSCCVYNRVNHINYVNSRKSPPNARQKGVADELQLQIGTRTLSGRHQSGKLWLTGMTGCVPTGGSSFRACLNYVELGVSTTSLVDATKTQAFRYWSSDDDYYYPALSINSSGDMLTSFNRSSPAEFPSIYSSFQRAGGAAGSFAVPALIKAGAVSYPESSTTFNIHRWGDYSGSSVDPVNPGSAWFGLEYPRPGFKWGTFLFSVSVPPQ